MFKEMKRIVLVAIVYLGILISRVVFAEQAVVLENFENTDRVYSWEVWANTPDVSDPAICKADEITRLRNSRYNKILRLSYDMSAKDANSCGLLVKLYKGEIKDLKSLDFKILAKTIPTVLSGTGS